MRTWILYGIGLGGLFSALSWFANLRSSVPGTVSAFPDLITFIALPVLVFLVLRLFANRHEGLTRATLRRAGMVIVSVGATLFAVSIAVLEIVRFSQPSAFSLLIIGFVMAFVSFLLVGWLSVWVASIWLTHEEGKR
jgi:hypothetical protein